MKVYFVGPMVRDFNKMDSLRLEGVFPLKSNYSVYLELNGAKEHEQSFRSALNTNPIYEFTIQPGALKNVKTIEAEEECSEWKIASINADDIMKINSVLLCTTSENNYHSFSIEKPLWKIGQTTDFNNYENLWKRKEGDIRDKILSILEVYWNSTKNLMDRPFIDALVKVTSNRSNNLSLILNLVQKKQQELIDEKENNIPKLFTSEFGAVIRFIEKKIKSEITASIDKTLIKTQNKAEDKELATLRKAANLSFIEDSSKESKQMSTSKPKVKPEKEMAEDYHLSLL